MTKLFSVEAWITQYFGHSDYATEKYANGYHEGLDLCPVDRVSWTLYAPMSGEIMWSGWGDTYGWNVILWSKEYGMSLRFCHLETMNVKQGDRVLQNQIIGLCGNTGNSEARHLHMNAIPMRIYNKKDFEGNGTKGRVDPLPVLRMLGVNV